jgi:NAD(P)-dependent dehydrogenase (short-subunit alcohol dehydrogenase family)
MQLRMEYFQSLITFKKTNHKMNILITGTSSGVGHGLANYYLDKGHTVFGISRNSNRDLDQNDKFNYLSLDLTRFGEIENKLYNFLKDIKSIDLAILNAGQLNEIKDLKDTTIEEIQAIMNINVWANKRLIDFLTTHIQTLDQVVAISSGAAVSGSRGWNAYSLSKATLNMLIDLYSKENEHTRFTALAPGIIDTGMQDYIYNHADENKYPVVKKLKSAKGTAMMPAPDKAAKIIAEAIEKTKQYESGMFLDVRKL